MEGSSVSGSVCIFTSLDVPSSVQPLRTSLQAVAVRFHSTSLIPVCCLYLPPTTVIRQQGLNNLIDQLPAPFVILGDFNGHRTIWGSVKTNHRGRQIEQLVKVLQVSRKSVGLHHDELGCITVLVQLIVQVVRQSVIIQIPEMGQRFQLYDKKSQLFKTFHWSPPLTTMRPLFPWARQEAFQAEAFIDVPVGPAVFGGRDEVGMVHSDANHFRIFAILRMLAMDSLIGVRVDQHGETRTWQTVPTLEIFLFVHSLDHHQAPVASGQLTKFAPYTKGCLRLGLVYQTKTGILVAIGSKIFGPGSRPGMIHGEENHFRIAVIPGNRGNGQFDGNWLAIVMKHVGISKIGWLTRERHV
ncbi:hypothetical protein TNCV_2368751 [Trichonephila clavipes]|nr:hypothetical protein TNCV_2368751 [Trichonephila clavipes]